MLSPYFNHGFGSTGDSIVCNAFPTDRGWRVHVRFPRKVPVSDRQEVLRWLSDYKAQVRQKNPYWLARLTATRSELTLDFLSADDPRGTLANALHPSYERGFSDVDYARP